MSDEPITSTPVEDLSQAVAQLRTVVVALGAIVLVVSGCFSGFVWKNTRSTSGVIDARRQQLAQMENNVKRLGAVANDLGAYAVGRPELLAIFHNHGIDLKQPPAAH